MLACHREHLGPTHTVSGQGKQGVANEPAGDRWPDEAATRGDQSQSTDTTEDSGGNG